jgi:hypothetical protein
MKYTIYNPATGEIIGTTAGDNIVQANLSTVEGNYSGSKFYIDLETLQPVERTKDPSTPVAKYQFDWTTKQWTYDLVVSAELVRKNRDLRLTVVDKMNPVWYSSLTAQQQQELQAFRQALLDVPAQAGFPQTVTWPQQPAWL